MMINQYFFNQPLLNQTLPRNQRSPLFNQKLQFNRYLALKN